MVRAWAFGAALCGAAACAIPLPPARPVPGAAAAHARGVRSVAFSQDGKVLASASRGGPVILWDVESRRPIGPPLVGERRGLRVAALSPDAGAVAGGHEDGTVVLWDTRQPGSDGTPLPARHRGAVNGLAFSPDGRWLASGGEDGGVILWDPLDPTVAFRLPQARHSVGRVLFSPDGSTLAVATSKEIMLYDARTRLPLEVSPLKAAYAFEELAFSADGRLLARSGKGFTLWDVALGRCLWGSEKHCATVDWSLNWRAGIAFSPGGRWLAVGPKGGDPVVELWALGSMRPVTRLLGHGGRRWGYLTLGGETGSLSYAYLHALAFSPDGRLVVSGGDDGAIIFWDMQTWLPLGPVEPAARSPEASPP